MKSNNVVEEEIQASTEDKKRNGEWVRIELLINIDTGEINAISGDREPCIHGLECHGCDTKYIGLELIKEKMLKRN